jgi:hypothetical protein
MLVELECGDDPARWAALGFDVHDGAVRVGEVTVRPDGRGGGLRGWTLAGDGPPSVDGIPTRWAAMPADAEPGVLELDHVVVVTDDLDRTVAALVDAGGDERRRIDIGRGRMAFVRLGTIVEVVERGGPARLWGLVAVLEDLGALPAELVGEARDAVQAGRRIVTARPQAGLETALAFMTPRVRTH